MILQNIDELRLYFPAHAIDSIDPFIGVIDNSEHDFLLEKLGTPLYNKLCKYYEQNSSVSHDVIETEDTDYYSRLVLLCQRVVAYDAMSRAVGMHIVSVNNAGVNVSTADDYGKVDLDAVKTFKQTCVKEAHSAVNRLLQTLEEWTKYAAASEEPDQQLTEIVNLWKESRFFYYAAMLLIPSATVLQSYWNIYDSREKFIQMLPDLHYIQEEVIEPAVGEEFCEALVNLSIPSTQSNQSTPSNQKAPMRLRHKLRKVMAVILEERTSVITTDKQRRQTAHDEAVRLLQGAIEYIQVHAATFADKDAVGKEIADAFASSPLAPKEPTGEPSEAPEHFEPKFRNNDPHAGMFVTPALN